MSYKILLLHYPLSFLQQKSLLKKYVSLTEHKLYLLSTYYRGYESMGEWICASRLFLAIWPLWIFPNSSQVFLMVSSNWACLSGLCCSGYLNAQQWNEWVRLASFKFYKKEENYIFNLHVENNISLNIMEILEQIYNSAERTDTMETFFAEIQATLDGIKGKNQK